MKRGDRYIWTPDVGRTGVLVFVTRVARDETWADLRCYSSSSVWSKRQPLPLPQTFRPVGVAS